MSQYTEEQLISALRNAHDAGDTQAARAIARRIRTDRIKQGRREPSRDELQRLFIAADKAGNEDDARFFLGMIDRLDQQNKPGSLQQQILSGVGRSLDKTGAALQSSSLA